jgi:hypothetical protein
MTPSDSGSLSGNTPFAFGVVATGMRRLCARLATTEEASRLLQPEPTSMKGRCACESACAAASSSPSFHSKNVDTFEFVFDGTIISFATSSGSVTNTGPRRPDIAVAIAFFMTAAAELALVISTADFVTLRTMPRMSRW